VGGRLHQAGQSLSACHPHSKNFHLTWSSERSFHLFCFQ
jgi:hypothetical protein